MGYRSDIRFLIPITDYEKLKGDCRLKHGNNSLFTALDKKEIRKTDDGKEFMYFGWDNIKWYTGTEGYEEIDDIENAVYDCNEHHMVRIGEDNDDIEEVYNISDSDVEAIKFIRAFEE